MAYAEKLKDPRWQRRRLEILNRDNFTCQLCLDKETELQIHHKEYHTGKEPWEYDNSILVTLCKDCHAGIKDFPIYPFKVIKIIHSKGNTLFIISELGLSFYNLLPGVGISHKTVTLIVQCLINYWTINDMKCCLTDRNI